MDEPYDSPDARLASEGINILSLTIGGRYKYAIYEYSWKDPNMGNKLHWSKSTIGASNMADLFNDILRAVRSARKELEADGE